MDRQRGTELDGPPEERAEDPHRALPAEVEPRRVRFRDPAQDREPRLRRRAEEAVEERALLVGRLGQRQRPGLDLAVARDSERQARLVGADLEPGDAADRLARRSGQEGSGVVGVWPRTTSCWSLVAAPAPPTEATTITAGRPSGATHHPALGKVRHSTAKGNRRRGGPAARRPIRPPVARSRSGPGSLLRSRARGGRRWSGPRSCLPSRARGRSPGRRSSGRGRGT